MKPFKDPIAVKTRRTSKDFAAPTKEGATTGRYMRAGDDYGVGYKTPVGSFTESNNGPIPYESKCFNPNEMEM